MIGVSFDPFEFGLHFKSLAVFDFMENAFDQVFVLDRFSGRGFPPVLSPSNTPRRHAVDRVSAVGYYGHVPIPWDDLEGS
jgi:hypothetical protein